MYGNVHCKRLYGNTKILIKEQVGDWKADIIITYDIQGTATLNVVNGSVAVVVKAGDIIAHVENITQDSFIELETGNVVLHVSQDFPFRQVICLFSAVSECHRCL